jgi:hypothetical protein
MAVKFAELLDAFHFVDSGSYGETQAFIDRSTGAIYWQSDVVDVEEEIPDGVDLDECLEVPTGQDLGLKKPTVLAFAQEHMPDAYEEIRDIFSHSGAYQRFRALLLRCDTLDKWYAFYAAAEKAALRAWCEEEGLEITD